MTVARDFGKIVFHCDGRPGGKKCHEFLETDTRDFGEALATLREDEWLAELEDKEWHHYCPECIGGTFTIR